MQNNSRKNTFLFINGGIVIKHCIYINNDSENFTYVKKEHIIPAGLGGIRTLPNGYVSDKVNEKFSPLEMNIMRNSFISINRNNFGPGKRGSLNVKKIKSPMVRVLKEGEIPNDSYQLGFIFAGESHIIPQIYIDFNDAENSCLPTFFNINRSKEDILSFQLKLLVFLLDKKRSYIMVEMPYSTKKHFINIGINNNKWFAATSHKRINMDFLALVLITALLEEIKKNVKGTKKILNLGKKNHKYTYQIDLESVDMHFLYLKTAFNTLAYLKGHEFVLNRIFNSIRESILNCTNIDQFIIKEKDILNNVIEIIEKTPEKSHYSMIIAKDNNIYGVVSFYNELPAIIRITNEYIGESFKGGLVCDWKNRKEMDLSEFDEL
ncbi:MULTISPECIES: hypothetical protein [Psychrilyobacter]|uniref:HNH endonuclease n=1 Tax=Psychrilyobacter piezotolerans TaxID=2293438 RepID=A0ABX9KLQ2_9FUSO|nr:MULTISPECIES: hypothetical protein [Psychrilyobacter]MCS5422608.1 hypothetical protein [Psychrilyobacter sp. S5]NDI76490.1 hypothetical protein [Psychrilyobacter piezotolerans]RDE66082.1 hypothetical protein DV867_00990 [Psychrilyobacter sp. S5]REI43260.1 hypothetical protein DYH56_00990 [Psychrilyobacter piezotolerans]